MSGTPLRRTTRTLKPSLKSLEMGYVKQLETAGVVQTYTDDEVNEEVFPEHIEIPSNLHDDEVVGSQIFRFETNKSRKTLATKVKETIDFKTPRAIGSRIKKHLRRINNDSDEEWEGSETSEESDSSEGSDEDEEDVEGDEGEDVSEKKERVALPTSSSRGVGKYVFDTEEYFMQSSSKVTTSNNTLDKLENPRLPLYQLQKLLDNMKISKNHRHCMQKLAQENESFLDHWLYILREGYNILLYGIGSKRDILNKFRIECVTDSPVVVINGFFPTLTLKDILDAIIIDMLESSQNPSNPIEACNLIIEEFKKLPKAHLYLIVHNIEGKMLRNAKSQTVLSKLSSAKNIHLIGSIDHINGPLIWGQSRFSEFNFVWWDVTSFHSYFEETSFESSMMVQQSETLALSSLRNVFLSLTSTSKSIYLTIAKYQAENSKGNQYYQGMNFRQLYRSCREDFTVSTDLALRAQLNEFIDHKMVKIKRSADGGEYLTIPLATNLLLQFIDENS